MDVERQIHDALEARFEKLAPVELKNIEVPMDLFRIVLPWEPNIGDREAKGTRSRSSASIPMAGLSPLCLLLVVL